ncbi:hypothetical protein Esti_003107 [Eimeria stiedai]
MRGPRWGPLPRVSPYAKSTGKQKRGPQPPPFTPSFFYAAPFPPSQSTASCLVGTAAAAACICVWLSALRAPVRQSAGSVSGSGLKGEASVGSCSCYTSFSEGGCCAPPPPSTELSRMLRWLDTSSRPPRSLLCCGAAACWVRAFGEIGKEPALPPAAFNRLLQQQAYRETLRLRRLSGAVLLLYLLLPFFCPEAPPVLQGDRRAGGPPSFSTSGVGKASRGPFKSTSKTDGSAIGIAGAAVLQWVLSDLPPETVAKQQQQQQHGDFAQLLLQAPLRPSRVRRLGQGSPCEAASVQCLPPPPRSSSGSNGSTNSESTGNGSLLSPSLRPLVPRLSLQWQWTALWLVSLLCVSFLGYYSLLAAVTRGMDASAAVPAVTLACCLVSAADYFLLLFGDLPAAAAAAAAAGGGGAWGSTRLARPLLLWGLQHSVCLSCQAACLPALLIGLTLLRAPGACSLGGVYAFCVACAVSGAPLSLQLGSIILALLLSVCLFDWLGVILFAGTEAIGLAPASHKISEAQPLKPWMWALSSLGLSPCQKLDLHALLTTPACASSTWPSISLGTDAYVLLCGYTVHEAAALFVVAFYLITAILLGLFAAAFFSAFRRQEEVDGAELSALRVRYLLSAFASLQEAGRGAVGPREWRLLFEGLAALPAASFKALTPEETDLLLQQHQMHMQVSGLPSEQRRLGTAALVSPTVTDEADWPPLWRKGVGSSRIQDWVSSGFDARTEVSSPLLQASPSSTPLGSAAAAARESEAHEAACLLRAWGLREPQRPGFWGTAFRHQVAVEAHKTLSCLAGATTAEGDICAAAFAGLPAALAAVGLLVMRLSATLVLFSRRRKAAATAEALAKVQTRRASLWARSLNLLADAAVAVSLVVTFLQTRKFILTASSLTGEPIVEEAAEGMPSSCFLSHATSYWLQLTLSGLYVMSAGTLLGLEFDAVTIPAHLALDAACLWAGAASAFHPESCEEIVDDLSRCIAFARVLRGLRIGFRIAPLKQMVSRLLRAVRRLKTVMQVLLLLFYTYATVGMELFRGLIEREGEGPGLVSPAGGEGQGGDLADLGLLNFNDLFSSLVTLFLLTVNGWDESLKALVKHTSVLKCSCYFVSFYILTDTILLNLLVALVLEAYEQASRCFLRCPSCCEGGCWPCRCPCCSWKSTWEERQLVSAAPSKKLAVASEDEGALVSSH